MALADVIQEIEDARVDAQSLENFIFQPAGVMVTRRLAPPVNTLQYYVDYMAALAVGKDGIDGVDGIDAAITSLTVATGAAGTAASVVTGGTTTARTFALTIPRGDKGVDGSFSQKSYTTYALMDADKVNIPANTSVSVTNDTDSTKNGMYAYSGTVFTKSAYDPLAQAKTYTDTQDTAYLTQAKTYTDTNKVSTLSYVDERDNHVIRLAKIGGTLSSYMSNKSQPLASTVVGWIDGAATAGTVSGFGVIVPNVAVTKNTKISKIKVFSAAIGNVIEVAAYTKSGDIFTQDRILARVTTKAAAREEVFDSIDFVPFDIYVNEYIGFIMDKDAIHYLSTTTSTLGYFYGAYSTRASFTDSTATTGYAFQIGLYDSDDTTKYLSSLSTSVSKSETIVSQLTSSYVKRLGALGHDAGTSGTLSNTLIAGSPAESYGTVDSFDINISGAGNITFAIFDRRADSIFTPIITKVVPVVAGKNTITLGFEILEGQYVGVVLPSPIAVTYQGTVVGHDGYFYSAKLGNTVDVPIRSSAVAPATANRMDMGFNLTLNSATNGNVGSQMWSGQTLVTFGDSITWYYGKNFSTSHVESGQPAIGYQEYIKNKLGCLINNQGVSGWTMPEIYNNTIAAYDFSSTFAVSITSGANDHRKAVLPGTVGGVGGTFVTSTFAGAIQASIERIINANKNTKIFLITPIRGYYFESGTSNVPGPYNGEMEISREYVDVMKALGKLYGIPVIDWYDSSSLNKINYLNWLGDNPAVFTSYALHPKNSFFAVMGNLAAEQMLLHRQ